MGNNPVSGTDPDGGFDWFVNNNTGQVLEAPGKGQEYTAELGDGWSWLAKDGAFSVPDNFVFNSASYTFNQNGWETRTWDAVQSEALMQLNNWSLSPVQRLVAEMKTTNHIPMPDGTYTSQTVTDYREEVWLQTTYTPEGFQPITKIEPLIYKQVSPFSSTTYHATRQTISYSKSSGFWHGLSKLLNIGSDIESTPTIYRGWSNYPTSGNLNRYRK